MSMPIPVCMIRKALTNDEALEALQVRLKYNKKFGSMSILPCEKHTPRCRMINEEESEILNERLKILDQSKS